MLPTGPPGPGNAPYSALSAFAGSPWIVSLEVLARDGLLRPRDLAASANSPSSAALSDRRVNYPATLRFRADRLRRAYANFVAAGRARSEPFHEFCSRNSFWLDDFALFSSLQRAFSDRPWTSWPVSLRLRDPAALRDARRALADDFDFERFVQFQFHRQWNALRTYARDRGVGFIGDLPIFVAHHSADVWANRDLFLLDDRGRPRFVSGCPPDAFNPDGQLWGHPHYDWKRHAATRFRWWVRRFRTCLAQFDYVRVDHFLGFHRLWSVPGAARTARHGRWTATPGRALFSHLKRQCGNLPIIAEDLGAVTRQAAALRDDFGIPGMRIFQFGFGGDDDEAHFHRPHRWPRHCVAYTGTHDNETLVGWLMRVRRDSVRHTAITRPVRPLASSTNNRAAPDRSAYERVLDYVGDGARPHLRVLRSIMASAADTVIFPMQDLLGLGAEHRMNVPGVALGNWEWRMPAAALDPTLAQQMRLWTHAFERDR